MKTGTVRKTAAAVMTGFLMMTLLGGCGEKADKEKAVAVSTIPVAAVTVTAQDFDKVITLGGLTAPENSSAVVAKISGMEEVLAVNVNVGDKVTKGQVLAQLDTEMSQINYNNAKMAYDDAERNYQNAVNLFDLEAMSEITLDQLKMARDNAQNTLRTAELALSYTTITAPISGTVSSVNIDEGAFAAAGSPLFVIDDVATLEISTGIHEQYVGKIYTGQEVIMKIHSASDQWVSGTITEVSKVMDQAAKNYPITIALNNQDDTLMAGMYAEIQVIVDHAENALVIPSDAIVYKESQPVAYVVSADGTARETALTLGLNDGEQYVVTNGLQSGDEVVVRGNGDLVDGTLITLVELDGNTAVSNEAHHSDDETAGDVETSVNRAE